VNAVAARPFAWERSYPPGVQWDAPIESGSIPAILDRAAARFGDGTAIEYFDQHISYRELAALTVRAAAGALHFRVDHTPDRLAGIPAAIECAPHCCLKTRALM